VGTRRRTAPAVGAGCSGESVTPHMLICTSLTSDVGERCVGMNDSYIIA
jgi:hypothetical protein